jgi:tetratricopeptide (TPR) repeat protein
MGLAVSQFRQSKLSLACSTAEVLCLLAPRVAGNWSLWARFLVEESKWERALAAANRSLELDPGNPDVRRLRVRCYARLGLYEAALSDAEAIEERHYVSGQIDRARVYAIRNGEHDVQTAVGTLQNAKAAGADLSGLADDPDFAALKSNEKFRRLIGLD